MKIFLSYSWAHIPETNTLDDFLLQFNVEVIRDVRHLRELDNIKSFMEKILEADFAILMINDSYLKSKNCMYEIIKLLEDKSFRNRAVPILFNDINISNAHSRITYLQYWEKMTQQLQEEIKNGLDSFAFASNVLKELEQYQLIRNKIDEFFNFITDHLCFNFVKEQNEKFTGLARHLSLIKSQPKKEQQYKSKATINRIIIPESNGANHIVDIYRLLLNLSNNSEIELPRLLGHLQEIANHLSFYFTAKTKSNCSTSIKLIQTDTILSETNVRTLIRDSVSEKRFSEFANLKTRIFDNTNYSFIMNGITKGDAVYFSNNLTELSNYKNTSFKLFGMPKNISSQREIDKHWTLPYKSLITAPIFNRGDNNETLLVGFLNIDSSNKNVFNFDQDSKLVSDIGEQLFFSIQRLYKHTYGNDKQ